ncbi:hypothetical protein M1J64_001701 [Salmonella enterica]|nr:hypothetical protein [Salmonella enterica]EJG8590970.1 hypothetical protein [Salmonella enterica]
MTSTERTGRRKTDGVQGIQKLTVEDAGTYSEYVVTTSVIKSGTTPGLWPGAAALFSGGWGTEAENVHGLGLFAAVILNVVTNFVFSYGARRLWRWEVLLDLSGAA